MMRRGTLKPTALISKQLELTLIGLTPVWEMQTLQNLSAFLWRKSADFSRKSSVILLLQNFAWTLVTNQSSD